MQDKFTQEWNKFSELVPPIIEWEKKRAFKLRADGISDETRLFDISEIAIQLGLISFEINKNFLSLNEEEKGKLASKLEELNNIIEQHKILFF